MKIAILLVLLGLARAKLQLASHKRDVFNAYANDAVLQRVTRAQPAIYPPEKDLAWVEDSYQRSYTPQPYSFAYDVNDGYNNYGHEQQSDGYVTSGSYRVLLPDGRTQIVNFRADKNGYVADVKYEVSIFKPAAPSHRALPVAPLRNTNAGQSKKASPAWTAFTAYQPDAKKTSYKADLIAALGYKTTAATPSIAAGKEAAIDPHYKTPAAVAEYNKRPEYQTAPIDSAPVHRDSSVPAYKPVAAPPDEQVDTNPTDAEYRSPAKPAHSVAVGVTVPEYRPPAAAGTKIPVAPVYKTPAVQVYRVPEDRTNKIPATPSVPVYRPPSAAAEYKAAVTPTYQVASAPEYEYTTESAAPVYTVPASTPTTPAYKATQVDTTTPYRPPTTPSVQAIAVYGESSTPAPRFRPAWTAFRYAVPEASTPLPYEGQPTTSEYPIAATTPAYRPPPPAYEVAAPAQEESVYEVTTVPAEISTTPAYQNDAAPWTAFRATEAPYQSPALPAYVPSTTVDSVRPFYETSTLTYLNEAPTAPAAPDVSVFYSEPESLSSTYEQSAPAAWKARPSVYVPAEETTTYRPEINDVTAPAQSDVTAQTVTAAPVVYEAPTTPSAYRTVPSAIRSPWTGLRPAPDVPLYYVAPTTYRPLNPAVYKVPDARVYESNSASKTSSSGPTWNAWTAFRSAPVRPVGRPGSQVSTSPDPSAYKLPTPLVYRNRKA
uniref:Putative Cuticle protein n=1 Tax=Daphnia magna TaxID=35525 RepID=A0A0P5N9H1_9CRUS